MKNKIFEKFHNKGIVINVRTQEEYNELMEYLEKYKIKWKCGDKPTSLNKFSKGEADTGAFIMLQNGRIYTCGLFEDTYKYQVMSYQEFMYELEYKKTIKTIDLLNMLAKKDYHNIPYKIRTEKNGEIMHFKKDGYYYQGFKIGGKWDSCTLNKEIEIIEGTSILDDKEKEYLRNTIRPFIDKVEAICKCDYGTDEQYIRFYLVDGKGYNLPNFKKDTMYKGMETSMDYTLEELGLCTKMK